MNPWLINALNAFLALASCYVVADVVTDFGSEALEPPSIQSPVVHHDRGEGPAVSPSVILARNLFGAQLAGDQQIVIEAEEEVELTTTKLPLRLLGTAASTDEARSRAAILHEKTKKHMVRAVGDFLGNDQEYRDLRRVRVTAIERSRVVLDNAGRAEELALGDGEARVQRVRPKRNTRQARRRPAKPESPADRFKKLTGDNGEGLSKLLSSARIVPHYNADGEMGGIKVDAIKTDSLFQQVGLQDGDIITEVNGIVIDRLDATNAIFDEFSSSESINISTQRGSDTLTLSASTESLLESQ